jgi:hypothetical protein
MTWSSVGKRVQAVREGFYGDDLKRVGDVFDLADLNHFSARWMVRVASDTPLRKVSVKPVPMRRLFRPVEPDEPRHDWDP